MTKVLITLTGDYIAPRFDLSQEVAIFVEDQGHIVEERPIVLSNGSAEALCKIILDEKISAVICCAIEEQYYDYLIWKKIRVIDSVMGSYEDIITAWLDGRLGSGDILWKRGA
jgi:predicted Fe-Mo cluster-binding NifX family protein